MKPLALFLRSCPRAGGLVLVGLAGLASGCGGSDDPVWVQFNAETDELVVEVGVAKPTDAVSTLLHSSSGQVEVGVASVDPGGGPIGTEHLVAIEVYDDYEYKVGRCTVRSSSPGRGEDEYEMDVDSADEGVYTTILVSVGDSGEQRSDSLTLRLWYDSAAEDDLVETGT